MKSTLNTVFLVFVLNAASAQTFDLLMVSPNNGYSDAAVEVEEGYVVNFGTGFEYIMDRLIKINRQGEITDSLLVAYPGHKVWIKNMLSHDLQQFYIYGAVIDDEFEEEKPFLARLNAALEIDFFTVYDSLLFNSHMDQCIVNENGNLFCMGERYPTSEQALFYVELELQGEVIAKNTVENGWGGWIISSLMEFPNDNSYQIMNIFFQVVRINRSNLEVDSLFFENSWMQYYVGGALTDSTYMTAGVYHDNCCHRMGIKIQNAAFQRLDSIEFVKGDTNEVPSFFGLDLLSPDSVFVGFTKNYLHNSEYTYGKLESWYGLYNINADGNLNWQRYFGGDCNYYLHKVLATKDGGALLIGQRWDWKNKTGYEKDVYIIKVDREGNFVPKVGIGINEQKMQAKAVLVYPNPATDKINIQSGLMRDLHFQLFDARGSLLNEKALNSSSESIDISTLPGGIYLYKTEGKNGFYESGKIVKE